MKYQSSVLAPCMQVLYAVTVFTLGSMPMGFVYAAEDDYLKSLEAEAQKIGGPAPAETDDEARLETENTTDVEAQRNVFESYLRNKHKGTFAFYSKLPAHSREEIFKAFVDGASMRDIRYMVVERKLNR